jgi:hypothetical protein
VILLSLKRTPFAVDRPLGQQTYLGDTGPTPAPVAEIHPSDGEVDLIGAVEHQPPPITREPSADRRRQTDLKHLRSETLFLPRPEHTRR